MGILEENINENVQTEKVKRRTLVCPWKNVAEFNKVYDWLFGDTANEETHRRALQQLRVWTLRRSHLTPAAILATNIIVKVQLQDLGGKKHIQTLYASAFTRFFNFMSSIMQTHNMRTMYETARHLGLHRFVVDLRHTCAHGQELPPMDVLRTTAKYCLDWLRDFYWCAQRDTMIQVDASRIRRKEKTDFEDEVRALLSIYDTAMECYMRGARNLKNCKRFVHGTRIANLKSFYESNGMQTLQEIFDIVVKRLATSIKINIGIKDLNEIFIEAMLQMKYFFTATNDRYTDEEFELLIDITQTLISLLAKQGLLEDFFSSLLQLAENPIADSTKRAGASFWATQLAAGFLALRKIKQMNKEEMDHNSKFIGLDFSTLNLESMSKKARMLFLYCAVDLKRTLIFGDTLRRPTTWVFEQSFIEQRLKSANEYTAPVLKSLLPLIEPVLSDAELQAMSELIDTYFEINLQHDEKSKFLETNGVYTAEHLLQRLNENVEMNTAPNLSDDMHIWKIVPDDEALNWSTCPLGVLPWE